MNDQQRAAMQMALEALEFYQRRCNEQGFYSVNKQPLPTEAITALREALAQPQGKWVDLTDDEVNEIVHEKVMDMRMTYKDLVRAVIAAFKEKNK